MSNKWYYNEFELSGTDFHDETEALHYMERIEKARNSLDEAKMIAKRTGLQKSHNLMDIGAGPALITVELAKLCREAVAADISDIMLKTASDRALRLGVGNIRFVKGGFLLGDAIHEKFDCIITQRAFHHVPTFWKQIALINVHNALNPGGMFYLDDVIFSFPPEKYESKFDEWSEKMFPVFGEYTSVANHVFKEYSDFTWVMEDMLERAGFEIVERILPDEFFAQYVCLKK